MVLEGGRRPVPHLSSSTAPFLYKGELDLVSFNGSVTAFKEYLITFPESAARSRDKGIERKGRRERDLAKGHQVGEGHV